jgi:2-amino-4-hydroxy-6-hydroxymethyldihydropteridine diphosphokinase
MPVTAYIALGSNLGDRQAYLDRALQALRARPAIVVTKTSPYHETEPVGGPPGQGKYLNAAAEIHTDLKPQQLLHLLLDVEQELGRVRTERDGPRTIDLDLLLYGEQIINEPGLIVPHPRMQERLFVLLPLAQIAAYAVHPVLQRRVLFLLEELWARQERLRLQALQETHLSIPQPASPAPGAASEPVPYWLTSGLDRELKGLRALVTGSTSGIGRAIALELAVAGANVIVHGRSAAAGEQLVRQLESCHVRTHIQLAELSDPEQCRRLAEAAWSRWDGLDVWINNAGADTLTGEAADWPFERKWQELFAVDVTATMLLARAIGQRMKERGSGVILNMGWDQAETGMEGDSGQLFGASKGAVMAFTRSLALTLAPEVRVNCLAPGWIRTAWGETASARWQERVRRETPLGRWGTPQDVAAVARWLVSPAASFLTGQIIRIDGGAVR